MSGPLPGHPYFPRRRATREVPIGEVRVGGANPIRIQSMTTTDTQDTAGTVAQIETLVHAGCEIVRLTVPSIRDAENLREIRGALEQRRVSVPLVADIHFTPHAAILAAPWVEKVRVNPGNFADKKRFEVREYSDAQYQEELDRVAGRFRPLVRRCLELGRSLRIGTNHGSLSDRILNRFGDTPAGMVESALEFLDVCESEGFRDVVFSMKASNPQVAVQAYRLLAARLAERAPGTPSYPLHVGVTEAGGGDEGRVKSAIGIGALLEDGLGDTIRVSLTEDPAREIPVAQALARRVEARWVAANSVSAPDAPAAPFTGDPFAHARRRACAVTSGSLGLGGEEPVRVELDLGRAPEDPARAAATVARGLAMRSELRCEGLRLAAPDAGAIEHARGFGEALRRAGVRAPLAVELAPSAALAGAGWADRWVVAVGESEPGAALVAVATAARREGIPVEWMLQDPPETLPLLLDRVLDATRDAAAGPCLVSTRSARPVHAARRLAAELAARALDWPIVLLPAPARETGDCTLLEAAVDLGAPLCDGIGDAVVIPASGEVMRALERAYRILQGARLRTSWTEFISCPSCGRTQFDLEETTARIQARTRHLKGVKIAVMGCIVNGPGEMADADFGYVGSGPGLVNLYVGKELVARHLPASEAEDHLIDLIRKHGRWTPSPSPTESGDVG